MEQGWENNWYCCNVWPNSCDSNHSYDFTMDRCCPQCLLLAILLAHVISHQSLHVMKKMHALILMLLCRATRRRMYVLIPRSLAFAALAESNPRGAAASLADRIASESPRDEVMHSCFERLRFHLCHHVLMHACC